MPSIITLCLYGEKCTYQKEYIIGRYGSKVKIPVVICTFNENCNQQQIMDVHQAKKLFPSGFTLKMQKQIPKNTKKTF